VAYQEIDNDVRMRLAEGAPAVARTQSVELASVGPLAARVVVRRQLLDVPCVQTFTLYAGVPRLDLDTQILWGGATDLQVRLCLPFAPTFQEVYYGTPFHATNWRAAMPDAGPRNSDEILVTDWHHYREILRWIDAGDGERGVTVASVAGAYHVAGPLLQAVLLRTPRSCGDPRFYWHNAGTLRWRHTLWPHAGDWQRSRAYRRGWEQAFPVRTLSLVESPDTTPQIAGGLVRVSPDNLVLTALKPAEDDNGVILRFFEAEGVPTQATLHLPMPVRTARRTNLIEDNLAEVSVIQGDVSVAVRPWEIVTLRLAV
jgi:alpha-mannosidase